MGKVVTYVYYERGWPVCAGPLDYVAGKTGRDGRNIMRTAKRDLPKNTNSGPVRVEMEEELEWRR